DGTTLFSALYRSWCHNAVATFSLCLLAQAYEHAASLLHQLWVIRGVRDKYFSGRMFPGLLEPDKYPHLFKCLYGILMLLPQSSAFATLRNRLSSVSSLGALQVLPKGPGYQSPGTSVPEFKARILKPTSALGIASQTSSTNDLRFQDLLGHFIQVQATHEKSRQTGNGRNVERIVASRRTTSGSLTFPFLSVSLTLSRPTGTQTHPRSASRGRSPRGVYAPATQHTPLPMRSATRAASGLSAAAVDGGEAESTGPGAAGAEGPPLTPTLRSRTPAGAPGAKRRGLLPPGARVSSLGAVPGFRRLGRHTRVNVSRAGEGVGGPRPPERAAAPSVGTALLAFLLFLKLGERTGHLPCRCFSPQCWHEGGGVRAYRHVLREAPLLRAAVGRSPFIFKVPTQKKKKKKN
ncbi:MAG: hypothetical protein BJ554DRAFT_6946, partial [Olpidium bornovanus]